MGNRILTLMICGGIMLLMYVTILALILSDLWSGVRKATTQLVAIKALKEGEYFVNANLTEYTT